MKVIKKMSKKLVDNWLIFKRLELVRVYLTNRVNHAMDHALMAAQVSVSVVRITEMPGFLVKSDMRQNGSQL